MFSTCRQFDRCKTNFFLCFFGSSLIYLCLSVESVYKWVQGFVIYDSPHGSLNEGEINFYSMFSSNHKSSVKYL